MRCLRYGSIVITFLFAAGCSTVYRNLPAATGSNPTALRFGPAEEKALYRCVIDGGFLFKKYHLSGILLFKKMPDASKRIVFQNEMGYTFFDFKWDNLDSFSVQQIIPRMDKAALVKTLRKDMEMLLLNRFQATDERFYTQDSMLFHRFPLTTGSVYYIESNNMLQSIVNTGKQKVVTITLSPPVQTTLAQTINIQHHKARFTILMTKLKQDAD